MKGFLCCIVLCWEIVIIFCCFSIVQQRKTSCDNLKSTLLVSIKLHSLCTVKNTFDRPTGFNQGKWCGTLENVFEIFLPSCCLCEEHQNNIFFVNISASISSMGLSMICEIFHLNLLCWWVRSQY